MEASTKVYTIHFNHNATHKGFNKTFPGGWVGRWVGSMVGGWVILGLILVQLKLDIQLRQNFGIKKKGRVNPGGVDPPPTPRK